ncbi:hypothetical protein [Acinetobacter sp. LMB-5]|uniref:hypothetical protein n=1 Tax=Acinetobacter sp. LMB-5 TaxID=1609919 RepID=UPI000760F672|nr:hypothetical protein [Acinetobacter sp. LMB-5]
MTRPKATIGNLNVTDCDFGIIQVGNCEIEVTGDANFTRTGTAIQQIEQYFDYEKFSRLFNNPSTEKIDGLIKDVQSLKDKKSFKLNELLAKNGLTAAAELATIATFLMPFLTNG